MVRDCRRIIGDDHKCARPNERVDGKGKIHAAAHLPLRDVDGGIGRVIKLDELIAHGVVRAIVVDFVDHDVARHIGHGERETLFEREAGAISGSQPDGETCARPAGEPRPGAKDVSANRKLPIVTKAGDQGKRMSIAFVDIDGGERGNERPWARAGRNIRRAQHDSRRRRRRRHHLDANGRRRGVEHPVVDLVSERIQTVVVEHRRVGQVG